MFLYCHCLNESDFYSIYTEEERGSKQKDKRERESVRECVREKETSLCDTRLCKQATKIQCFHERARVCEFVCCCDGVCRCEREKKKKKMKKKKERERKRERERERERVRVRK